MSQTGLIEKDIIRYCQEKQLTFSSKSAIQDYFHSNMPYCISGIWHAMVISCLIQLDEDKLKVILTNKE